MEIGGDRLVFVYARQGEYVLLGSRNRGSGGDILVHAPQASAGTADDASSATADFRCSSQRGRGAITGRAQELAGPHSADGTSSVRDGFAPCWHVAPRSGAALRRALHQRDPRRAWQRRLARPSAGAGRLRLGLGRERAQRRRLAGRPGRARVRPCALARHRRRPRSPRQSPRRVDGRPSLPPDLPWRRGRPCDVRSERGGRLRAASGLFQRRRAGRAERHRGRPRAWRARHCAAAGRTAG